MWLQSINKQIFSFALRGSASGICRILTIFIRMTKPVSWHYIASSCSFGTMCKSVKIIWACFMTMSVYLPCPSLLVFTIKNILLFLQVDHPTFNSFQEVWRKLSLVLFHFWQFTFIQEFSLIFYSPPVVLPQLQPSKPFCQPLFSLYLQLQQQRLLVSFFNFLFTYNERFSLCMKEKSFILSYILITLSPSDTVFVSWKIK